MDRDQMVKTWHQLQAVKKLQHATVSALPDDVRNQMQGGELNRYGKREGPYEHVWYDMAGFLNDMVQTISMYRRELREVPDPKTTTRDRWRRASKQSFSQTLSEFYKSNNYFGSIAPRRVISEHAYSGKPQSIGHFLIPLDYARVREEMPSIRSKYKGKDFMIVDGHRVKSDALTEKGIALYTAVIARMTNKGAVYQHARIAEHLETKIVATSDSAQSAVQLANKHAVKNMLEMMEGQ